MEKLAQGFVLQYLNISVTVIVLNSGDDSLQPWSIAKAAEVIYYGPGSLQGLSLCYLYNAPETQMTSKSPLRCNVQYKVMYNNSQQSGLLHYTK